MNETEKKTFSAPSPGELEQLTELHKAMGDYTRMRILWYLMQILASANWHKRWRSQNRPYPTSFVRFGLSG